MERSLSLGSDQALASARELERDRLVPGANYFKQEVVLLLLVTIEGTSRWKGQANMHAWGGGVGSKGHCRVPSSPNQG